MADILDDTEKLLARATAAIAEATRLMEENRKWQAKMSAGLRRMHFSASFYPKTLRLFSPLDFPDRRTPYQPFPTEAEW